MSDVKTYTDMVHCGHCDKDTPHTICESGHERDSSNDWRVCLRCGWRASGLFGEYRPPIPEDDGK